jgi:tight adherence protein B
MIQFAVFLFCLLLTYAVYLLMTYKSETHRERLEERLAEVLRHSARASDTDLRLARADLMSEIPWLNRALVRLQVATRLRRLIDQANLQITVMRLVLFSALAGTLAVLAAGMVSSSFLLMGVAGMAAAALPLGHVVWARQKRLRRFLELLPDALELMSRSLAAGHAFPESLHMVSTEMPEPVATEFRKTYEEQNLGLSLKLALNNLADRIPLLDLRLCITAVLIQRETGGNLSEILGKVSFTIRERFRIMEDLKTLTTSSRMSAWLLCGLPIFVAFLVTAINPKYMSVLWSDPRGHKIIAAAIMMQITGMLIVRKILRIRI